MQAREDEEVKAQLIQTIDKLTSDNSCLKTEMDLVLKSQQEQREALESKVSEFEPWNLGQEPSVPSRKSQQSKASSGGDSRLGNAATPPRRQSYTPPDTIMVTDQVISFSISF